MSSTTINNPEPSANTLSHQKVSRLTSTALFAALICVTTAYIFHIPFGVNGGYVHIGDSLIYLAAAFLPTPYAMFAGAIGGAMADILTAPVYAPATFIIKMLISLPITCKKDKIVNVHNCVGVVVAAVISFIGYYITDVILFGTCGALISSKEGLWSCQSSVASPMASCSLRMQKIHLQVQRLVMLKYALFLNV